MLTLFTARVLLVRAISCQVGYCKVAGNNLNSMTGNQESENQGQHTLPRYAHDRYQPLLLLVPHQMWTVCTWLHKQGSGVRDMFHSPSNSVQQARVALLDPAAYCQIPQSLKTPPHIYTSTINWIVPMRSPIVSVCCRPSICLSQPTTVWDVWLCTAQKDHFPYSHAHPTNVERAQHERTLFTLLSLPLHSLCYGTGQ